MMSDRMRRSENEELGDVEIAGIVGVDGETTPPSAVGDVEIVFDEPAGVERASEPAPAPPSPPEDPALQERLIRLRADFENLKKRVDREKEDLYLRAARRLFTALLPVLDNLERALTSSREDGEDEGLRSGVRLIHRQLLDALRREGLRPVEALGRPFDPHLHEAVATEVSADHPAQTVLEELQPGYFLHNYLLRPALVKVSVEPEGVPAGEAGGGEA